ncbi:MAG: hypothetical protein ACOCXT_05860, partial [Candidatus Dojkabacteria bacterium]
PDFLPTSYRRLLALPKFSSKDYSNEVFYEYFIAHSPEYREVIEEVVKLLRKRVQLPRNLLSAEYAREYDVRIRRVLGV